MTMYRNLQAAFEALCVDCGYNPFLHGGIIDTHGEKWLKPTSQALTALGYIIEESMTSTGSPPV